MKARIFWIILGAVLITGAVFFFSGGPRPLARLLGRAEAQATPETVRVTTLTAITAVESSGTVAPLQSATLAWKTSGTVAEVLAAPGDMVQRGDVLLRLDMASAPNNVLQARSDLLAAHQALEDLMQPSALAIANAEKAVVDAEDRLEQAQSDLTSLTTPNITHYEDQVAAKQQALIVAQQNAEKNDLGNVTQALQNARDHLETMTNQLSDAISAQEQCPGCTVVFINATGRRMSVEDSQQQYDAAVNALRVAEINFEQAGNNSQDAIDAAQDALDTAIANLAAARRDPDGLALSQRQAALTLAEANLQDARETLASLRAGPDDADLAAAEVRIQAAQATLDSVAVIAPFDGEILAVRQRVGDPVSVNAAAVVLANRSQLHVNVSVDETDVGQISVGNPVTITVDALPDLSLAGVVGAVDSFGETVQGLVRYGVRINLREGDPRLYLDMTASAMIVTAVEENALAVPLDAIQFDNDGEYVTRVSALGATERVAVATGAVSGDLVAVRGDLQAGDTVLLQAPTVTPEFRGPFGGG